MRIGGVLCGETIIPTKATILHHPKAVNPYYIDRTTSDLGSMDSEASEDQHSAERERQLVRQVHRTSLPLIDHN